MEQMELVQYAVGTDDDIDGLAHGHTYLVQGPVVLGGGECDPASTERYHIQRIQKLPRPAALTLTKTDAAMLKIIDPWDAQR